MISQYLTFAPCYGCLKGPERELLQLVVFGELQALFPGVRIHIEFIGPAIPLHRSIAFIVIHVLSLYWSLLGLNAYPSYFPVNRDGERIGISQYAHCNEDECACQLSGENVILGKQTDITSAVTLQLWRGFYHDRYRDMVEVSNCQHPKSSVLSFKFIITCT